MFPGNWPAAVVTAHRSGRTPGPSPWSTVVPTWITTLATVGLFVGAVITAVYAARAYSKQSQELVDQRGVNAEQTKVLRLQAEELRASLTERQNQAAERRRAQASLIYIWEDDAVEHAADTGSVSTVTAHVKNTSEQPIYDVRFIWRANDAQDHQVVRAKPLMPGEQDSDIWPAVGHDRGTLGAVVLFRDRSDWWWRAWPNGKLDDLGRHANSPDCW